MPSSELLTLPARSPMTKPATAADALDDAVVALEARDALAGITAAARASSAALADAVEALDELGDTLDKHLEAHDAAIEELETATRQAGAAMTATAKALAQLETGARRPTSED